MTLNKWTDEKGDPIKCISTRAALDVNDILKKLRMPIPHPSQLTGHEDNVGDLLISILEKLGYDAKADIKKKPQIKHAIVKGRREPDLGVYRYRVSRNIQLYGIVTDFKAYRSELTLSMEEKLAGYCGLAGALYGILTNGAGIIIIKPTRGVVEWSYCDRIPKKYELVEELKAKPKTIYTPTDITYAKRITKELDQKTIESLAQRCHEIIRSRKGLAVPERLYEFSKLLITRIVDERKYIEGDQGDLLITREAIQNLKAKRVSINDYAKESLDYVRKEIGIFEKGESVDLPSDVVEEIIDFLDDYPMWVKEIDVLGQVYEKFLMNTMTGQELGQYFTPRSIVECIIGMVDPKLEQTILDPAVGTGGFLIYILNYLKKKYNITSEERKQIKKVAQNLYGIDIFDIISKLCKINMWLHGDAHENEVRADSLDIDQMPTFLKEALLHPETKGFQILLTNPPFGARGGNRLSKDIVEKYCEKFEKQGINMFECAYKNGVLRENGIQPQSAFLELCMKALKVPERLGEGGVLGIVIDNGILSNTRDEEPTLRQLVREHCVVEAVVGLPGGSFKMYGSMVIPSFIILRRKHLHEKQGAVFRAEAHTIGYVPASKRFRSYSDADFKKILECWREWKKKDGKIPTKTYGNIKLKVIDSVLPIWVVEGDIEDRLDNNFFSPSSFEALKEVDRLETIGKVRKVPLKRLVAKRILTGVEPTKGAIQVLEGRNIQPNYINPKKDKFTSSEQRLIEAYDLLISKDGSPGVVSVALPIVLEQLGRISAGTHVYIVRLQDQYEKHTCFITSFLNSKIGQGIIRKFISGSVSSTIRRDDLSNVIVVLPTKDYESLSRETEQKMEQLQKSVLLANGFMEPSRDLTLDLGMENDISELPINWMPGGKRDAHRYYKERKT